MFIEGEANCRMATAAIATRVASSGIATLSAKGRAVVRPAADRVGSTLAGGVGRVSARRRAVAISRATDTSGSEPLNAPTSELSIGSVDSSRPPTPVASSAAAAVRSGLPRSGRHRATVVVAASTTARPTSVEPFSTEV